MNLKTLSLALLMLFTLSFAALAQKDEEEAQMFGSKRETGNNKANVHDFGIMSGSDKVEFEFKVKNVLKSDLTIGDISFPEGIGVVVLKKNAKADEEASFTVIVNAAVLPKGDFSKDIVLKIVRKDGNGIEMKKDNIFNVKGVIK